MTYQPGSTGVNTPALEAWRARTGVCQDYAHLVVGTLRQVGLPARYVSGYLHPDADAAIGETAVGESHAWVEWWLGDWTGHDPTNNGAVGERHVLVGRGRDYTDVPPIKGLVAGSSGRGRTRGHGRGHPPGLSCACRARRSRSSAPTSCMVSSIAPSRTASARRCVGQVVVPAPRVILKEPPRHAELVGQRVQLVAGVGQQVAELGEPQAGVRVAVGRVDVGGQCRLSA